MNIKMQCCGIILLLLILYFYICRKKIKLYTAEAFMRLFWITMINIFLDTLSIVLLTYHKSVSELMIDIVCKSYLSTLILTGFSALLYICIDIYNKNKTYRNILTFGSIISVLGIILIFYSPIYKSVESSENIYTYGPSVLITYAFALAFLTINIILLICQKKKLNPIRRNAMCIWMFLWFLASGIQFFFKELLLVGFFSSLGIIITYLKLENPELNIDKSTGLFNREAMLLYMNQLLYGQKDFSLIELILPFSLGNHFSGKNSDSVQKELTTYLSEIKCAYPFVINDNSIVLIFEDKELANRYSPAIRSRFNFGWGTDGNTYINLNWAYMPDGSILNKAEDIFSLLDYAKTNGKSYTKDNAIMITRKLLEDMHEEKNTERLVFEALEHNRVEVFYQPIYSTHHKRFTSAEALVRLRDNEDNIISPTLFIPVAEKNGSILQLGEIVFEKVCRFLKDEQPQRYGVEYIEVNLSVVQCAYDHLAESFIKIMEKYKISPEQINLEITESASVEKKNILLNNMEKLMDYGITFSLDDFGTGQSNLNYIAEMPVDIVKFDRSMTASYFENDKAKYIMDAAMHMIHGMRLKIVSEGIETRQQFDTMKNLGINYIQGYYFSKPLPEAEFMEFVKQRFC